jgi:AraC-like DNA-binding protein
VIGRKAVTRLTTPATQRETKASVLVTIIPFEFWAIGLLLLVMSAASGLNGLIITTLGFASVAARIGYESEAAFSRAFKKMIGLPPSAWRRGARSHT